MLRISLNNDRSDNAKLSQQMFYHDSTALKLLPSTNLALGNRLDPADCQVDGDGHNTNDPQGLVPGGVVVPEHNGEDDTTKVTTGTGEARDDTIGVWVNVWHERVVQAVGALEEEGEANTDQ